jgi:hypothetical protein
LQCKTGRSVPGAVSFRTCSNTGNVPIDYRDDIDAFAVYAPGTNAVYVVPVARTGVRGCRLRLEPTRNNQATGVRWAADYLIGPP